MATKKVLKSSDKVDLTTTPSGEPWGDDNLSARKGRAEFLRELYAALRQEGVAAPTIAAAFRQAAELTYDERGDSDREKAMGDLADTCFLIFNL